MSLEWDLLTWKEKKAVKAALKNNDGLISKKFLENVYSDDNRPREIMEKLNKHGFLEKSSIGNKYKIKTENIPGEVNIE